MIKRVVIGVTLLLSAAAAAKAGTARPFTAADVPNAKLRKPGKVVISNEGRTITAWHFFGNIREALVKIRTATRRIHTTPYGPVVFDPNANVTAPRDLAPIIADAARTHGVDPRLVAAVMRRESAWDANAKSTAGACGLMQLMPATAKFLGVADIFDVRQNIFGGTRYLRTLLDTFNGDLDLALAAYNAGPGAVEKWNGIPPYRETQAYVAAVKSTYEKSLR
ncbi:MAG TPA: lytic transglycosylase domain-containing protein [Thermoanaerobaculia bacterium]